ncbi:hypothetical protein ACQKLN_18490 [Paenibacillus glucanolyticus]|uniref:hypothetical protein n=1 Tax=Paenibacillus glucanolyticus TaxID=59843 RepID=UPI0036B71F37
MRRYWSRGQQGECKEITGRRKKKQGRPSHSIWCKLRMLHRKLIRNLAQIRLQLSRLTARVQALQEQVNERQGGPSSTVTALLTGKLNTRLTVETTAGSVFGTLIAIGEDFVQIAEPNGSIAIIPMRSFLSIS